MSAPDDTPDSAVEAPTQPARRIGLVLAIAAVLLAADVVTKVLVVANLSDKPSVKVLGGLFYLLETRNSGAAFSFAQGATVLFTAVAVIVVAVVLRTASRLRSTPWAVVLGLILGGATGNLADRVFRSPGPFRGHVVDWISFLDPYGQGFPVFNLADSGIVVGGILAVLLSFAGYELAGGRSTAEQRRAAEAVRKAAKRNR